MAFQVIPDEIIIITSSQVASLTIWIISEYNSNTLSSSII